MLRELLDFSEVASSVGMLDVVISMILSLILTLILTETYKVTHRGTTYSQQLIFTMIIMSLSISVIMLIIGSNIARAFSLVGALSIVRFRNPIKESRDLAFIFVAVTIGMGCGTAFYMPTTVFTVIISIVLLIMHFSSYGSDTMVSQLLKVELLNETKEQELNLVLQKYFEKIELINQTILEENGGVKFNVYTVKLPRKQSLASFSEIANEIKERVPVRNLTFSNVQETTSI